MATSLDQVQLEKQTEENKGKKYPNDDVEMAVRMGVKILKEGKGLDVISKAVNESKDPAMVIGQFLAQIMAKLAEQMRDQYGSDPGMFLAKGGWLDFMLDWIEKQLGYPSDFSDKIYEQVLEVIKAAAMGPDAPNNVMDPNAPPGQAAPPPPQQAAPPNQQGGF